MKEWNIGKLSVKSRKRHRLTGWDNDFRRGNSRWVSHHQPFSKHHYFREKPKKEKASHVANWSGPGLLCQALEKRKENAVERVRIASVWWVSMTRIDRQKRNSETFWEGSSKGCIQCLVTVFEVVWNCPLVNSLSWTKKVKSVFANFI